MKVAYFDCSSGVSGDMILSALFSCGVNHKELERYLKLKLKIKQWELKVKKVKRENVVSTQTTVHGNLHFNSPTKLMKLISASNLPDVIKRKSKEIVKLLSKCEKIVHNTKSTKFHEIGNIDTLIDIVGSVVGMDFFKVEKIISSPVNIGFPAPVSIEIVKRRNIPVFSDSKFELATPTGLAILSVLVNEFSHMPIMSIYKYGFGAGAIELPDRANVLRLFIGDTASGYQTDRVILLETNIDDMDPRIYPYLMERLFKNGALDVWYYPVHMKKGRLGIVLNVLCPAQIEDKMCDIVFRNTTTLGIRRRIVDRWKLRRRRIKGYKIIHYPVEKRIEFNKAMEIFENSKNFQGSRD